MNKPSRVADHLRKAERALESGHTLLTIGDTEGACNRAYYAMFNAAHVALQSVRAIEPGMIYKTHGGLISAFSKHVVVPGRVESSLGRSLSKVYATRILADYTGDQPDPADARWAIEQADAFVETIRATFGK